MEKSFGIALHEKLKSKKRITNLFNSGKHVSAGSIHLVWQYNDELQNTVLRFSLSVAKRNFKLAIMRNLLKRRMREAFRLNKSAILEHLTKLDRKIEFMIIFKEKKDLPFEIIETDLKRAIDKLITVIN